MGSVCRVRELASATEVTSASTVITVGVAREWPANLMGNPKRMIGLSLEQERIAVWGGVHIFNSNEPQGRGCEVESAFCCSPELSPQFTL